MELYISTRMTLGIINHHCLERPYKESTWIYGSISLAGEINSDFSECVEWRTTFCIYAGVGFENRQPGGNAEKKYDYKIIEKFLRKSQAPNQSW